MIDSTQFNLIAQSMNILPSIEYILADHLGSSSITTNADGDKTSEVHYTPWGEVLDSWSASASLPMEYTFTGQMSYMDDPITSGTTEGFGLMFFNARWLDPAIGRFTQADSIVPTSTQGVQAYDRYAYTNNNPVRYTDPTGHCILGCIGDAMVIGALVSVAIDVGVQYSETRSIAQIDPKKVLVAAGIGAVAGLAGGGVAILAVKAGVAVAGAAGSLAFVSNTAAVTIGSATELVAGAGMSALTNISLSTVHRSADDYIDGKQVTWDTISSDLDENIASDAVFGAMSYGISIPGESLISKTILPPQNSSQKLVYSLMQAVPQAFSNTDLLSSLRKAAKE